MIEEKNINSYIQRVYELEALGEVVPGSFDPVFKSLFQLDDLKGILVYMLEELTELEKSVIETLRFTNTEIPKERYTDKGKITDLLIDIKDNRINLEVNQMLNEGILNKGNAYHHDLAGRQLYVSENYTTIKKVIQICFNVKDELDKFGDKSIIEFKMRDETGKYILDENFTNIQINLSKIYDKYYNKGEKLSRLEKILLLLTLKKKKDLEEISKGDKELVLMKDKIEEFSENPEIVGLYDVEKAREKVNQVNLEAAEKKGMKKGIEQRNIDIARNMLTKGLNIELIVEVTGVTKEQVEALK